MALDQVAARLEGDVFQGRFFWHEASALLNPNKKVIKVAFEHDPASGADDIAVFFQSPGVLDKARYCEADFYQCKYHVDQRDAYSSEAFIDPAFLSPKSKSSLLQRLHMAYTKLRKNHGWFRLNFVSNWTWKSDDPLAKIISEVDGALPKAFFEQKARAPLGVIRETWRRHLGIEEPDFLDFSQRLRFGLNYYGRRYFLENLNDRLENCGLAPIPPDRSMNPYDSLYLNSLLSKENEFDRDLFFEMCKREGLLQKHPDNQGVKTIGIRSFMRFAERMEDETESFVCVAEHFDKRYIKNPDLWIKSIIPKIRYYLSSLPYGRDLEIDILLDCHSSLAFLAGYCMERKAGIPAYPVQKGQGKHIWKPSGQPVKEEWKWKMQESEMPLVDDVALLLSVTHDVSADFTRFIPSSNRRFGKTIHLQPATGIRPSTIQDADHAQWLAEEAMQIIRKANATGGITHVFAAAPNALMFFLGQYGAALKGIQLYEFDFDLERGGSYCASFCLP
jgi:hypothetical protein